MKSVRRIANMGSKNTYTKYPIVPENAASINLIFESKSKNPIGLTTVEVCKWSGK